MLVWQHWQRKPEASFANAAIPTLKYSLVKAPASPSAGDGSYPLFEGTEDHKLPTPNPFLQQCGMYVAVGKFIVHSILRGGPGLHGLSPVFKNYVISGETSGLTPVPEDIPDPELSALLMEVQDE